MNFWKACARQMNTKTNMELQVLHFQPMALRFRITLLLPASAVEKYVYTEFISKSIHEIMDLAIEEGDHPTKSFLQWFVDEQVEEEDSVQQIVENFRLIGDSKGGLFMLDRELGSRTSEHTE
jgi:hypothetical protein